MSSTADDKPAAKGVYRTALPTDLRSPCPVVNSLANHGYIPRDGRNVSYNDLYAAIGALGVGPTVNFSMTSPFYLVHRDPITLSSFSLWSLIRHPIGYLLGRFGVRNPNQKSADGESIINLDQLSRHDALEHDVSMTRRDYAQGDNHSPQKDLIQQLLAASSDGDRISPRDFAKLRQTRLEQQRRDNPALEFGALRNLVACGQLAVLQAVFGGGDKSMPVEYAKALFGEERLPVEEGWRPRVGWGRVGVWESAKQFLVVRGLVGGV